MAIKVFERYGPRANPADGNYPNGSFKNESVPGANDGTPLEVATINDLLGFTDALLNRAGIQPSGLPDTTLVSQRLEALLNITSSSVDTTVGLLSKDLSGAKSIDVNGYSVAGDGGSAKWLSTGLVVLPSAGTVDFSTAKAYDNIGNEFVLDDINDININALGMFADTAVGGTLVTDWTNQWLSIVDTLRPSRIRMPKVDGFSYRMQTFKVKADSEVFGDGSSLTGGTVVEVFYTGSFSPVMCQINSDSYTHDIRVASIVDDLDNSRATMTNSSNARMERVVITGFRDVDSPTDAWGMYLSESSNSSLVQCGFDDNTQSDVAFVGNVNGATLDGCYGEAGALHVNFEPNTSTDLNENITLKNMKMSKLSLLENGSGGTANRNITVQACGIGECQYDGAQVTLTSCSVDTWSTESEPFFGELRLENTVALGPNLLDDPFMINVGFDAVSAAANGNAWFMNSRTGAIGGDQLDALEEDGVRFVRINPNQLLGTVNFAPVNPVTVTTGEFYLIAVTGRRASGSDAVFITVNNGAADLNCRIFRQSNLGENYWTTEMLVVPAVTGVLTTKVGPYTDTTSSVDIRSITVHKLLGKGGGESAVLGQFHGDAYGVRELLPVATLPVFGDPNVRGVLPGDRVSLTGNGAPYRWDGSSWQVM